MFPLPLCLLDLPCGRDVLCQWSEGGHKWEERSWSQTNRGLTWEEASSIQAPSCRSGSPGWCRHPLLSQCLMWDSWYVMNRSFASGSQNTVPGPTAATSAGDLSKMQTLACLSSQTLWIQTWGIESRSPLFNWAFRWAGSTEDIFYLSIYNCLYPPIHPSILSCFIHPFYHASSIHPFYHLRSYLNTLPSNKK